MSAEKASIDFHYKIEHYKEQYEPMDAKIEVDSSFIKVFNGGQLKMAPERYSLISDIRTCEPFCDCS